MIHYKKHQYGIFLSALLLIIAVCVFFAGWFQIGNKPAPLTPTIVIAVVLVITFVIFHKLTITIDATKIQATFGLGLIKQTMLLKDIDFNSIELIKVPFLYGIGIRLTPEGTLYNVKLGSAIKIKSSTKSKTFFVGTDDFETIKRTLNTLNKH